MLPGDEAPAFEIYIDGKRFTEIITDGWCTRRFDSLADEFQFRFADLRTDLKDGLPITAGQECVIALKGQVILTGYVDDTSYQYDADNLSLMARGRSKTADLVDCSALRKTGRWRNANIRTICEGLCEPFGIDVKLTVTDANKAFRWFAVEPGEAVYDTIRRACQHRDLWATNDVEGRLLLTRADLATRATKRIEYGINVIRGERYDSWQERHSEYLLRGQAPGSSDFNKQSVTELSEVIADEAVTRYRPLLIVSSGQDSKSDLKERAIWERNRRYGMGERWIYRVDGYGYKEGDTFELWQPNRMIYVKDDRLSTDRWLFASSVTYKWQADGEDGGRVADITLVHPESFHPQPPPPPKKGSPPQKPDIKDVISGKITQEQFTARMIRYINYKVKQLQLQYTPEE